MRHRIKTHQFLQQPKRTCRLFFPGRHTVCLFPSVGHGQLHLLDPHATLRDTDIHLSAIRLLQQFRKKLRILHRMRQQNFLWNSTLDQVILLHQRRNHFPSILTGLQNLIILVQQIAVCKMQHGETALILILIISNDIRQHRCAGSYDLLLLQGLHCLQSVPKHCRFLEPKFLCGLLHPLSNFTRSLFIVTLQKLHGTKHGLSVLLHVSFFSAPAFTVPKMVVQAGTTLADVSGKGSGTIRKFQRQTQRIHDLLRNKTTTIRAEIFRTVIRNFPHKFHFGIGFTHIDTNIGIPLIVFQQDIIPRYVPFDQGTFQHQCLKFRAGNDGIKCMDLRYHLPRFKTVRCRILKVLADPIFQFFCLSHIDNLPGLILHQIDTGLQGQRFGFLFQFLKGHCTHL